MKKAYELAEKLLTDIDLYSDRYITSDGRNIKNEDAINTLNTIIQAGFALHKYLIEKKLYEDKPEVTTVLIELGKYIDKLQINKENAEKLHFSNVLQIWDQAKMTIAVLACVLLDYRDAEKNKNQ